MFKTSTRIFNWVYLIYYGTDHLLNYKTSDFTVDRVCRNNSGGEPFGTL